MGTGAFTAARLVSDGGLPFWPAVVIAAAVAGAAGLLLSLPALRLRGLDLALLTLGAGLLVDNLIFSANSISGGVDGVHMVRPPFAHSDLAFLWLTSVVAAVLAVAILNLRGGRTGRVLFAMRQSEPAARTLGISLRRYRVAAFVLSAAMAGLAGAFYASFQSVASRDSFTMMPSLLFLTIAVVGGVASVGGAVVAALLQGLSPKLLSYFGPLEGMSGVLFGLGATLGLAHQPEGIWGQTKSQIAWVIDRFRRTPAVTPHQNVDLTGAPPGHEMEVDAEIEEPVPA
jgi:ABC-type branched-subunit amino acid transport system permease subunit